VLNGITRPALKTRLNTSLMKRAFSAGFYHPKHLGRSPRLWWTRVV